MRAESRRWSPISDSRARLSSKEAGPLRYDLEYRSAEGRTTRECHAEEVPGWIANQFSNGLCAASADIEVIKHRFGPGNLSRRGRREFVDQPEASDSVAHWSVSRSCSEKRAVGVHDEAALRVCPLRARERV
jgi:hypothetical protein